MAWLWRAWLQIWPNLAANVLWVPLAWMHHRAVKRRLRALHEHQAALHRQQEQLLVKHVLGPATGAEQEEVAP